MIKIFLFKNDAHWDNAIPEGPDPTIIKSNSFPFTLFDFLYLLLYHKLNLKKQF